MYNAKVIATGGYLPKKKLSNDDLSKIVDTSDEWITERTGIKFRHIAADDEFTSDLAANALTDAISNAGVELSSLDGIIVATTTPDLIFPATACLVQKKMGINTGFAFDVSAVCSGFIYALSVANSMIKTGAARRIAVIGAETMSRIVDWEDRSTCVLFGDGAGAVILEQTREEGILGTSLFSDGTYENILKVPGGPSFGSCNAKLFMQGREVYRHALDKFVSVSLNLLAEKGLSREQVDWYIPHQANKRIIDAVGEKLGIDPNKVIITVDKHANTSAASIPLALNDFVKNNKIKSGDLIQMSALGAGLTWGAALLRF